MPKLLTAAEILARNEGAKGGGVGLVGKGTELEVPEKKRRAAHKKRPLTRYLGRAG